MKQYLVIVMSLTLIVNSHCGLIDGLFDTVKDTTSSIKQGIGGVFRSGKNFVFGSSEPNATGQFVTKPGLVDKVSLGIHDVAQAVRDQLRGIVIMVDGDQVHGKGIVGRLFDRVKYRVFKIKSFLFGDGITQNGNIPYAPYKKLKNDTSILCEKLRKYVFKNNTSTNSGIRQTLFSLQETIYRIRHNITKKRQDTDNENSEQDGVGLIDIRTSVNDLAGRLPNDFENGIDAAYDKVDDAIDEGRGTVKSSINSAKQNTDSFIEDEKRNVHNYNRFDNNADRFKSDVDNSINDIEIRIKSESDKVEGLKENAYSNVDFESKGNWGRS